MIFWMESNPSKKKLQLSTFQPNLSIKAWKLPFFFTSSSSWRFSLSLVVEVSTQNLLVVGSSPQGSRGKTWNIWMIYWGATFGWFYPHLFGVFSGSWYAALWKNILRNDCKQISVSLDEDALVNACNMQEADKFKLTSLNINKVYKRYTRSVESLSVRFGGVDSGTALPCKAIWYE